MRPVAHSPFFRPRGLAGALLIIKIAGELAEQGKTMNEIVDICQKVRGQLRTIGLSASGIRAPGHQQTFQVRDEPNERRLGSARRRSS